MRGYDLFGRSKILNSVEAQEGANHLMEKLENETLKMDILPNRYPKFSGELEEQDYISYCDFLKSSNGKKVLNMLEEEDAEDFIEL